MASQGSPGTPERCHYNTTFLAATHRHYGLRYCRYTLSKALGSGICLRSDTFTAGGQQFQLEVYPAGVSADSSHHLSIFLTTLSPQSPQHVLYEVAIVDQVSWLGDTSQRPNLLVSAGCGAA